MIPDEVEGVSVVKTSMTLNKYKYKFIKSCFKYK